MSNVKLGWLGYPNYRIEIKPIDARISIVIDGQIIADSHQILQLLEQDHDPAYYFPMQDIQMRYLQTITKVTFCPFKGDATHWALMLGNTQISIASWCYQEPFEQVSKIKNYMAFYPEIMEHAIFDY